MMEIVPSSEIIIGFGTDDPLKSPYFLNSNEPVDGLPFNMTFYAEATAIGAAVEVVTVGQNVAEYVEG